MSLMRQSEAGWSRAAFRQAMALSLFIAAAGTSQAQVIVRDPVELGSQDMSALRTSLGSVSAAAPERVEVFAVGVGYVANIYLESEALGYGTSQDVVECVGSSLRVWACRDPVPRVTVNFRGQEILVTGFEHPGEALFLMDSIRSRTFGCPSGGPVSASAITSIAKLAGQRYQLSSRGNGLELEWAYGSAPRLIECIDRSNTFDVLE